MASALSDPSPGCVCFKDRVLFETFLERNRPSEIKDPKLFWVYVERPGREHRYKCDIVHVQILWKQVTDSGDKVVAEDIKAIAAGTGQTSGKWIFKSKRNVDDLWEKIAIAVVEGKLGSSAKVSTKTSAREQPGKDHVICVYTDDFTNEEEVMEVGRSLRNIGAKGKMTYKPDVYTNCGIYFKNPWGIDPNLYRLD